MGVRRCTGWPGELAVDPDSGDMKLTDLPG
jgi:hypothetical protein